jgi:hypothetical protein
MVRPQPHVGRTLLEIFWEELDDIMDRLMEKGPPSDSEPPSQWELLDEFLIDEREDWKEYGEERGQAQGVAYCIAVMTNPYKPDIDAVRELAMERWETRHA